MHVNRATLHGLAPRLRHQLLRSAMTQFSTPGPSPWNLIPQGDRCLILEFGRDIDVAVGRRCANAARILRAAGITGITDIVPTFNSVAVHYRPHLLGGSVALADIAEQINRALLSAGNLDTPDSNANDIEIPVCYGGNYGPDLLNVAQHCGLDPEQVIALHSGTPAYVFMLGFAPGAPYIGVHDQRLSIGRRSTPRTVVPAGSVAIANRQTMIYPNASPGGWHLIGSTPVVLFDPERTPATLLSPGDTVRFRPVSPDEFEALKRS
jgi:KipI family sensor histidine kinase inhibitor